MRMVASLAFVLAGTATSFADDLTVRDCLQILAGLNSLNFVGQVTPQQPPPPDAKSYRFGKPKDGETPIRLTMGFDINSLMSVQAAVTKSQQSFIDSLGPAPTHDGDKPFTPEQQRAWDRRQKDIQDNGEATLNAPCSVAPGKLPASQLRAGDGDGDNQIPPSVIGVLKPIIDLSK